MLQVKHLKENCKGTLTCKDFFFTDLLARKMGQPLNLQHVLELFDSPLPSITD